MLELVQTTLAHFREAVDYTLAIRTSSIRLRLACLWPVLIGLETLLLLVDNDDWLNPARVSKIRRSDVYRLIVSSLPLAVSNGLLRVRIGRLMRRIDDRIKA